LLRRTAVFALLTLFCTASAASSVTRELALRIAVGEGDDKIAAVYQLAESGDPGAQPFLQALSDGLVKTTADQRVLMERDGALVDVVSGAPATDAPDTLEDVVANNRMRLDIAGALAGLGLLSPDAAKREQAAKVLEENANPFVSKLIETAIGKEAEPRVRQMLVNIKAGLDLSAADVNVRLAAVKVLGSGDNPKNKTLLSALLQKNGEEFAEPDKDVRAAAQEAIRVINSALWSQEQLGNLFSGVSLASILLLAALGLAITYGLMGVINMAHGELMMIGAYATYVVQNYFRSHYPELFDWYPLLAIPVAFFASALIGIVIERSVIRFLYGRTLETLLSTWGISLILIQATRTIFGAQNVAVENPVWLSGGLMATPNLVLPYNRIAIIAFAMGVLLLVWLLLTRTRLGLYVRAVTQNRSMAGCLGISTPKIDMLAFGLGSGVAGLAGCALSQVGNVGPALGQGYIVDSFMVVVLGGVGQLAGTAWAALGLGVFNKILEAWSGAVLAKISILVFIIFFIQRRPQGLFALKGRTSEN